MFWQKIKVKLLLSVLGIIIILSSLQVKSEEIILHVTVNKWSSGFMSISKISTYLVPVKKNKKFTVDGWRSFDNSFIFDKIQFDTLVKINFNQGMVIAGTSIITDYYLKSLDIGLDTVSIRTPSSDAGTDFSFFIDTTQLAKTIVKKNFKKVIEITEIDNPADWVFTEEILHPNGKVKLKWQEKHNERFQRVKHGLFEEWDLNGIKKSEAFYKNGNNTGTWKLWTAKGEILQTTRFIHKDTAYRIIYYQDTKQVMMQGTMIFELNEGEWEVYDNNGKLYSTILYKNGKQVSVNIK